MTIFVKTNNQKDARIPMNWTHILLHAKGRIDRKTFLLGLVPVFVLCALLLLYLTLPSNFLPGWANYIIPAVITLEALYFFVRLLGKRLHDFGRSAAYLWLHFAPLILAGIFFLQQKYMPSKASEQIAQFSSVLIALAIIAFFWILLETFLRSSDRERNQYGPPPTPTDRQR